MTGFVGPNGAGKSTTMRMILGLDAPDAGRALVGGRPYATLEHPLREVGALLDAATSTPACAPATICAGRPRSNGLPDARVPEVLSLVGLESVARRRVGGFSLGMRQRLGIARALLGDPPLLLFDEPVNGLDPEGIRWIRGFLRSLAAEGRDRARLQPPDERAGGHGRPPGRDRARPADRRRDRCASWSPAAGGSRTSTLDLTSEAVDFR